MQPRSTPMGFAEGSDAGCHLAANLLRDRLTVDDVRHLAPAVAGSVGGDQPTSAHHFGTTTAVTMVVAPANISTSMRALVVPRRLMLALVSAEPACALPRKIRPLSSVPTSPPSQAPAVRYATTSAVKSVVTPVSVRFCESTTCTTI